MKYTLTPLARPTGSGRFNLYVQIVYEHDGQRVSATLEAGAGFTGVEQATNAFFSPEVMAKVMARARQLSPGAIVRPGVKPATTVAAVHPSNPPQAPMMTTRMSEVYGNAPRLTPTPPPRSPDTRVGLSADGKVTAAPATFAKPDDGNTVESVPLSALQDPGAKTKSGYIRVHEGAKRLGIPWQRLSNFLVSKGHDARSHMAIFPESILQGLTADMVN